YIEVPNEPDALVINYFLAKPQEGNATVTVANASGETVAQFEGPARMGLNRVLWNMRAGSGGEAGRRARGGGEPQPPGEYRITVEAGGGRQTVTGRIRERLQR